MSDKRSINNQSSTEAPNAHSHLPQISPANRNNSVISSSSNQSCNIYSKDSVKEVFEKDPSMRNSVDIEILAEFTKTLPAFMNLTVPVRRKLCSHMVYRAYVIKINHFRDLQL